MRIPQVVFNYYLLHVVHILVIEKFVFKGKEIIISKVNFLYLFLTRKCLPGAIKLFCELPQGSHLLQAHP